MKSILFISLMNGSAWGGSEELWFQLALFTSKKGIKTGVVCYDWEEKKIRLTKLEESGCTVYRLNRRQTLINKIKSQILLRSIPISDYELQLVNQGGWEDVTHAPFKQLYKSLPNYILLYHNYEQGAKLKKGKQKLLKRWADHARLNAAACQQVFYELKKTNGINIEKAEVFTNPLSFNPPQKPTPYPSVQNSIVIWVMLAALDVNRKAQDVLINTLSADKWKLRNWELHLYGTGKDHEHIEELIKYNGLESKIMLKGHTNDSLSVLQSAHWLFQCTHKDAMPLSVMEAMATGRPCFVSNTGDMALWIKDGFNGLVCETATNKNIDLKLDELWNKQQLWAEMGLNAFETFQKKFPSPYEKTLLNWLESYC